MQEVSLYRIMVGIKTKVC